MRLEVPAQLPIATHAEQIRAAIQAHPVVVVAGDTGSGKTTQLPKLCLQTGRGRRARIAVTQPRRVAATSLSRRLAEELGVTWGRQVGARVRFGDHTTSDTVVKFVTDGMLLAEVRADRDLRQYDTVIVDEAHERSLNIDFLLGYLRQLRTRRPDLKVIITSATIDTDSFVAAFDGAPLVQVSGRLYPVDLRHWPVAELLAESDGAYTDAAALACEKLLDESHRGDVLVFMPAERDIRETCDLLTARLGGHRGVEVMPLFSRLSAAAQHRVFHPHAGRRIVVATNIAETSLTIPGIRYVVDTGLARISRYNPRTHTQRLPIEAISQASALQRAGRCGRVEDGVCVRLYDEQDLAGRPRYTQPEIQRADLADVILRLLDLEFGAVEDFPFIDPPAPRAVTSGYQLLQELGAIDDRRQLTRLGRDMARLPIAPTVSRMVLQAHAEGALPEVLVIAAAIAAQDPRQRPPGQEAEADRMHARFVHPRSDFLTLYNIWLAYHDRMEQGTQSQLRRFCRQHHLSFQRMREWRDIHAQLHATLKELGDYRLDRSCARRDDAYDVVHRCILTGLLGNVAHRRDEEGPTNLYTAARSRQVMLFPGSGLFARRRGRDRGPRERHGGPPEPPGSGRAGPPPWIVAAEMVETSRLYARTAAVIEPAWILDLGGHLCRTSHRDPHWSRKAGRVLVHETVRLFGLVVAQRRVGYARIAPREARDIFVREALIAGDVEVVRHPFFTHNRRIHERLEAWQARRRQRHPVDLDDAFHDFYAERLPAGVASLADLDRIVAEHGGDDAFLHADEAALLDEDGLDLDLEAFPDAVDLGGTSLQLDYAYAPGQARDGVTLQVPYRLFDAVRPEVLDWLVPGLLEARIAHLLRSLPKALRKRFVPVPEAARRIAAELTPSAGDGTLLDALEGHIEAHWQVVIRRDDWDPEAVPEHLRVRVEVQGTDGSAVAAGRDLTALTQQLERPAAPGAVDLEAWKQAQARWERQQVTSWSFGDLPERLEVTLVAGVPVFAFPGLALEEDRQVTVRLFTERETARRATPAGFLRLCELDLGEEMGWLRRELQDLRPLVAPHASLGTPAQIEHQAYAHLCRYLFLEEEVCPLTTERFAARVATARQRLVGLSARFLELLADILELRRRLVASPRPHPGLPDDLARLVPAGFLDRVDYPHLPHLGRYLKASLVRADRFGADPARDAAKAAQVGLYADQVEALGVDLEGAPVERRRRVQAFARLVEEFRVSVFAQELGTAQRVSPARLERARLEVDRAPRGGSEA